MKQLIETVLIGVLIFIIVVGIIILIGVGLSYVLQYIPCEVMVYVTTGLLLGIFMLVANLLLRNTSIGNTKKND